MKRSCKDYAAISAAEPVTTEYLDSLTLLAEEARAAQAAALRREEESTSKAPPRGGASKQN